jgi:hypothetical protein
MSTITTARGATGADTDLVVLSDADHETAQMLALVREEIKSLKNIEAEYTARLKDVIGDASGAVHEGHLVATLATRGGARRVDYDQLATTFPEAYNKCVTRNRDARVLTVHAVS